MKKILTMLMMTVTPVMAQEPPKQFNLTVTMEDLQVIGNALDDLPFKKAAPIIQKLNQQIQAQQTPPTRPATLIPVPTPKPETKE